MRFAGKYLDRRVGALVVCAAFGACSYDFDGLVAHTSSGGAAGAGTGTGGAAGQGGSSGAAGSDEDGGGAAGTGGGAGAGGSAGSSAGSSGAAGTAGTGSAGKGGAGGTGGTAVDAGKGGNAGTDAGTGGKGGSAGTDAGTGGKGGTVDAAGDRGPDAIADVRAETTFDCTAVSGTVYQGHCYYLSSATTSWDTANTTGCGAPSHLVVITTAGEQAVVAAILPGKDRWIGLHKDLPPNQKSSLHWITGEALSYEIWDSYETGLPEPNYTGDCFRISPADKWGDTACSTPYPAICEYE